MITAHGFRHEALFYGSEAEFVLGTVPFIRHGLERGEVVLVVESQEKIALLKGELGEDESSVHFADMEQVGSNPARIIPAWTEFVAEYGRDRRGLRGIGEPIWAGRSEDALVECQRHESLINVAFGRGRAWKLLCPYDTSALPSTVLEEARRSHAFVSERQVGLPSPHFRGIEASAAVPDTPLRTPPAGTLGLAFRAGELGHVRSFARRFGLSAGLEGGPAAELVSAVNEIATNSVRHGGGQGTFLIWRDGAYVVCEVRDRGLFDRPLADRERADGSGGSRGLWLANQLCDLVQIRAYPEGTIVRLHKKV